MIGFRFSGWRVIGCRSMLVGGVAATAGGRWWGLLGTMYSHDDDSGWRQC